MIPLRWKESAVVEAEEAAAFYDQRTGRGGKEFIEQLWAAVSLVREYPEAALPTVSRFGASCFDRFHTVCCISRNPTPFSSWLSNTTG